MIELISLDDTIWLDIRYAREDNFIGRAVYSEARAFMQPAAAEALVRAHRSLAGDGLGLVIFDGYRPWSVTKLFWDFVTEAQRKYVADPAEGSVHNRGCAVDLSLCELATGRQLPMPSDFDEFTESASPEYMGGTDEERRNRDLLRRAMESQGFTVNANEWWHFDFAGWERYPIMDIAFSQCSVKI
ncbi:MAG: M15 family metallopeptidase [Acidobacteriota bacterium]|nr:MAG: M15 family metallopeptidase [Acidobacteriota bacterium]